jgi:hypothetical protein
VRESRIKKKRESRDFVAVRGRTYCKEAIYINTNIAVFPACYSVYVLMNVFMCYVML